MTAVIMAADGRLVLPPEVRDALGVSGEETFDVRVQDGEIRLMPTTTGIHPAQALVRAHAKKRISSDEFLAMRERD